jgi:NTP pyrophosphatase (non-canonical NTP hydrolase)
MFMDNITYLRESARTASTQFHDEIVDGQAIARSLIAAIAAAEAADQIKKSLFYGKALDPSHPALGGAEIPGFDPSRVDADILHAALGLFTEAGELLETIFKAMAGEEPFDRVNVGEELGDCEWYMAMLYRCLKLVPEQVKAINIAKLRKRFPEKFTTEHALTRDLEAERAILEGRRSA